MPPATTAASPRPRILTEEEKTRQRVREVITKQHTLRLAHAQKQQIKKLASNPTAGTMPITRPTKTKPITKSAPVTVNPAAIKPTSEAWLWSLGTTGLSTLVTFVIIAAVFATVASPALPAFLMGLGAVLGALALAGIVAGGVMLIGAVVTSVLAYVNRTKPEATLPTNTKEIDQPVTNPALGDLTRSALTSDNLPQPLTVRAAATFSSADPLTKEGTYLVTVRKK